MRFEDLQSYVAGLTESERGVFSDEALILSREPSESGYEATPTNYVAFAWTGGNGVHFAYPKESEKLGPVVMTVPMAFDRPNLVLGRDLHHFMCLGCRFGYFGLESLAYQFERTAGLITAATTVSPTLRRLAIRFGLRPWADVAGELVSLQNHLTMR